jgi:hypothetical protein
MMFSFAIYAIQEAPIKYTLTDSIMNFSMLMLNDIEPTIL